MDAIEDLRRCARAAEALDTVASLDLAGRLFAQVAELERGVDGPTGADGDTSLKAWAAAERARR